MCFLTVLMTKLLYWALFLFDWLAHSSTRKPLCFVIEVPSLGCLWQLKPLVSLCVLLTRTRQKIINKSDRKWICMTDNLSVLWNRASPRQTLVARRTSNWNDISWRQQPVEPRGTSVQEWGRRTLYNSCTVWPARPVRLYYLYTFPSLNSPIRKGKGRICRAGSHTGFHMHCTCECEAYLPIVVRSQDK